MKDIRERLKDGEILLADGAMGTMLIDRGLGEDQCPEEFNLERIDILEELASLYLKAGADIIQTNTFGASPLKLSLNSLDDKTEEINKNAVEAVRKAVGTEAYVSGSCGPTGKLVLPYGDTDPAIIYDAFYRQIESLINAGIDILCIETMTDTNEALEAIKAARTISSQLPIIASMTWEWTPRGYFTIMGISIEEGVRALEDAGVDIIGSNCGNGIGRMIGIAGELTKTSRLPIMIQSNAGLPELVNGKLQYKENIEYMSSRIPELLDTGISIVGGCCGTTPEYIKAFRSIADNYKKNSIK